MDIIPWVTQLNGIFQNEDLDFSIIQACISTTLSEIAKVKEGSGYYTKKLDESLKQDESGKRHMGAGGHEISYSETQKAQAIKSRDAFIDNLTEQISARFPQESQDLVDAFAILSLRGVYFMTTEDLSNYGNKKLLKLLNHCGSDKANVVSGRVIPAVVDPYENQDGMVFIKGLLSRSSSTQLTSYPCRGVVFSSFIQTLFQIC